MGKNSAIAWTTHTFNLVWGCTRLPERRECDHCYAAAFANRTGHHVWGKSAPRRLFGAEHWHEPFKWDNAARQVGRVDSVFCGSMCDVFEDHPDVASQRPKLWDLIRRTPNLRWLLLTKRPLNAPALLPMDLWLDNPRVLVGATVGTRIAAEWPTCVDFISSEPLLEAVNLRPWLANPRLRGVIIGGESRGSKPGRECREEWVRDIIGQCRPQGVSVFVKQLHIAGELVHDVSRFPADLRMRELGWSV